MRIENLIAVKNNNKTGGKEEWWGDLVIGEVMGGESYREEWIIKVLEGGWVGWVLWVRSEEWKANLEEEQVRQADKDPSLMVNLSFYMLNICIIS